MYVTLPAYNAEHTLERTLAEIPEGTAQAILVVDDASPDNTVSVARKLGHRVVVHPQNRGYGGNQKTCYSEALADGADIVVLLHPDYQYDPKAVPLLIAPISAGYADMTFGSRFAATGDPLRGGMPLYRYVGNRVTTVAENLLLGSRFTEMHSGLRAYTRDCLLALPFLSYSDDFFFDSQLLVDAVTKGMRVVEVPIRTRYTKESSSIDVPRSIKYVSRSLGVAARRSARRGRRGRRAPTTFGPGRKAPLEGRGPHTEGRCVLCGSEDLYLLYPANFQGEPTAAEFACTSEAVSLHDDILQCRSCGMVSARPTLSGAEILDCYARTEDTAYLDEGTARRELFDRVLDTTEGYHIGGKKLVEIGSHIGLFLDGATRRGWEASGVEPSEWAVAEGRRRFGVDLSEGSIETFQAEPKSIDVFVMLDVLEHLVDPVRALARLRTALSDDGLLVLSTIDLGSLHSRVRREKWPWFILPHLHYFRAETLNRSLRTAGFVPTSWDLVPRRFHLSYLAHRAENSLGAPGRIAAKV
ncbi:MAG: bifunctional glycosyltransferase/class I SAM-dependent methyltransferase, partial [Actinomycetota bacterium]|nr:bifunctional glycosyltransferase/class I SAM-dependent methyltransferase [Actinomycetota bacterium]